MPNKLLLIFFLTGYFFHVKAQSDINPHIITPHVSPAIRLTENMGQWEDNILFRAGLDGGALFLEKNALTFNFYDKKKYRAIHHGSILKGNYKDLDIKCHAYKIIFENCNAASVVEKSQQGPDYENFYLGKDKGKWKSRVRNYHQVFLRDLYKGIDYEMITGANGLKYNFHVKANADPSEIKLQYKGVDKIKLLDGTLVLHLSINDVIEQKPYAYQLINGQVKEVKCAYRFKNNVLGFDFAEGYDKQYELVIDPVLVFAAQSGSTADNFGMTATYDTQGNLYSGGTVFNNGYPVTLGAFSTSFSGTPQNGITDVVITKYNSTGNSLLFSTYIGGSQAEIVSSLIVDANDNLCFYGATGSSNFPVTTGAYDVSFNGGQYLSFLFNGTTFNNGTDIYIGKFNSTGTALLGCTYLGGSDNDGVNHVNHLSLIAVINSVYYYEYATDSLQRNYGDQYRGEIQLDALNNIYITSSTRSSDFPTVSAYDNTLGGKQDAIVSKFNSSLTQLLFSTYLGGSLNECGNSIIVNSNSEVYVTGGTCSSDFPVTPGANSTIYNGGQTDGFITHFNVTGNSLLQSTFVGTNSYDQCYFIQTDKYNDIYVYGQSLGNMPIVNSGTFVPYNNPGCHQFITRFNSSLSVKNMSTVFGYSYSHLDLSPSAFAVDKCNNIYLSGWGGDLIYGTYVTTNMPLLNATQNTTDGYDFYFMGLDSNAVNLKYGSYFGGPISHEHVDGGTSRFDPGGRIYQSVCAGCGGNEDFPVTPGAWPGTPGYTNHSSNCNNGVVKIDFQLQLAIATISTNTLSGCSPLTISLINATPPAGSTATYTWDLGNGNTTSATPNPVVTYTNPGTYTIMLTVMDNLTCNKIDRTKTFITVLPKPNSSFSVTGGQCTNTVEVSSTASGNLNANPYSWDFGDGSPASNLSSTSYTYPGNGTYTISLTVTDLNGCKDIKTNTITIFNFSPGAVNSSSLCYGSSTTISATGGTSYTWSPTVSLNNGFVSTPIANPVLSTIYTVQILNNTPGYDCGKTLTTQVQVLPTPTTGFTYIQNPCGGDVRFIDYSTDDIVGWFWTLSPTKTSTVQNAYNFYTTGGTYTVSLTSTNIYGCKDAHDTLITLPSPPPVSVNTTTAICRGKSAQLNATGGISYQWTPVQSLDFPALANPIATPSVSTDYSVIVTTTDVVNDSACKFLLITGVHVDVLSASIVSAKADPVLITTGETSTLTYAGDPGALVSWMPPGSTRPQTGYTVNASPDRPTTYTAIAQRGACVEDVTVHIDAYSEGCIDKDAFVPNTFTPNGDGENDIFRVKGIKITEVYFAVYNRWGEKVFETNDLNKGWDGMYKGKQADIGVFGWYLKVKCINGEEAFKKGNVTLIR
jgi:gliding motility-associated-like protein